MSTLLEINSVRRVFRRGDEEIAALNGVNLSVNEGDFIAITGSSGSGKSTLLYLIGLLDSATSGSYKLEGQETSGIDDSDRAKLRNQYIGFVFQSFHLLPRLSALRNVCMPLVYSDRYREIKLSTKEQLDMARASLEKVGLGSRMQHLPNELSGGQRQRVAIARALVNNPKLILADEPTGNLDSKTGLEMLSLLKDLNNSGATILMVTHDRDIAAHAKNKIVMRDGVISEMV